MTGAESNVPVHQYDSKSPVQRPDIDRRASMVKRAHHGSGRADQVKISTVITVFSGGSATESVRQSSSCGSAEFILDLLS